MGKQLELFDTNPIETCVMCGVETDYRFNDNVNLRFNYIEGMGQLCGVCYNKGTDRNHILVPEYIIKNTPNDFDLGEKIRQMYYDNLKGLK
jgi:hypothetical protein